MISISEIKYTIEFHLSLPNSVQAHFSVALAVVQYDAYLPLFRNALNKFGRGMAIN